ncbi:uncharacterized [Tachysurus ichikawai]
MTGLCHENACAAREILKGRTLGCLLLEIFSTLSSFVPQKISHPHIHHHVEDLRGASQCFRTELEHQERLRGTEGNPTPDTVCYTSSAVERTVKEKHSFTRDHVHSAGGHRWWLTAW